MNAKCRLVTLFALCNHAHVQLYHFKRCNGLRQFKFPVFFRDIPPYWLVVSYRSFGIAFRPHLQELSWIANHRSTQRNFPEEGKASFTPWRYRGMAHNTRASSISAALNFAENRRQERIISETVISKRPYRATTYNTGSEKGTSI